MYKKVLVRLKVALSTKFTQFDARKRVISSLNLNFQHFAQIVTTFYIFNHWWLIIFFYCKKVHFFRKVDFSFQL